MKRFVEMSERFEEALIKSAQELEKQGFKKAPDMCREILGRRTGA